MTNISITVEQLKQTLKEAIVEIITENKEEFSDLIAEIIEDIALSKAIEEGEKTDLVDKESILKILEQKYRPFLNNPHTNQY
jgi:Fe2+ transport system protein B